MLYKKCRICENIKELDEFHKKKGSPDGHRNECKECVKGILKKYKDAPGFKEKQKEYDKNRYSEIRDDILENKKTYYKNNKKAILSYKKNYRVENKEQIKEWRENNKDKNSEGQAKYRERYPHIVAWRSVLHSTLKRLNTPKQGHTIDMLGYSALELKEHIEKQFLPGMTWENHGDWHIDHKKPVTLFESTEDIKVVCALDNLQPLWAFDNLTKSNNYE
jgi:hypothetical protein